MLHMCFIKYTLSKNLLSKWPKDLLLRMSIVKLIHLFSLSFVPSGRYFHLMLLIAMGFHVPFKGIITALLDGS